MWLFQNVGRGKLPIINYSGGTEISGGIVMGNVLTPMKPCAFSGPLPGMAADVVDENGKSVRGKVGELVIREPWIGMTRGFWRDPQRYLDSYWSRWPGTWVHGDWPQSMMTDFGTFSGAVTTQLRSRANALAPPKWNQFSLRIHR